MSIDLKLNAFPGIARGPEQLYDVCRVLSDGETCWIFVPAGSEARLARDFKVSSIEQTDTSPSARWNVVDDTGFTWEVSRVEGGCNCGNPLRRYSAEALLGLIGIS